MLTIQDLRAQNLILLECITGSRAYNLDLPTSDTDIKGVFLLPKNIFFSFHYIEQINDENNNVVFYELGRFIELLSKNNPNLLEMLNVAPEHIIYKHPILEKIQASLFLSKLCKDTFAGYAISQIKKARGLNKKIVNPMLEQRKSILHFCYVTNAQGSKVVVDWLEQHQLKQEQCGLVNVPNMKDVYALFYDKEQVLGYKGIVQKEESNQVSLSSIPKGEEPLTHLYFNKDGYTKYCKDYREYWEWVNNRNEERYENTQQHGKNYDSKNMMHTFRLLDMAAEILESGVVNVQRKNREALLAIRKGLFEYDDLIQQAHDKMDVIERLYLTSPLPETPNLKVINELLVEIRTHFYG